MLVVVTVLCVLLGWKVPQRVRQREIVAWIEAKGGDVNCDYQLTPDKYFSISSDAPGPLWLGGLLGSGFFATVVRVELKLRNDEVADLSPLPYLPELQQLSVRATQVDDISPLERLTKLKTQCLCGIDANDLAPLAGLKSLEWLGLRDTPVSEMEIDKITTALPNCEVSNHK